MSDILEVISRIQDTEQALSMLRTHVSESGRSDSIDLSLTINSLYKRQHELEQQFEELTEKAHVDVCSYRLIAKQDQRYSVTALSDVLLSFQYLLTIVYDAIKSDQPKTRANWGADIANETSLDFGYSYSGSLGFMFTMPNERLLLVDSILDMSFTTIFEMAKSPNPDLLSGYAKKLGAAPIRNVYKWANSHLKAGLSVDIAWRRKDEVRSSVTLRSDDLQQLCEAIEKASELNEVKFQTEGILLGGDIKTRTFHFAPVEGEEIKGILADNFSTNEEIKLGHSYTAELIKTTKVYYSMEKEEIRYYLVSID